MITVAHHKKFKKSFRNLRKNEIKIFEERVGVFITDPYNKILNNHQLNGKLAKYRSIDINGDLRVMFEMIDESTVLFIDIGTHSYFYS